MGQFRTSIVVVQVYLRSISSFVCCGVYLRVARPENDLRCSPVGILTISANHLAIYPGCIDLRLSVPLVALGTVLETV